VKTFRLALLGLLLAASGCSAEQTAGSVELTGPSSMAVAGRNLLVAQTTGAQLKALLIDQSEFERAPNPLFALSIPTATFPRAVASWTSADASVVSPYAFALSSAASRLTVISTSDLTRVAELAVPSGTLAVAAIPQTAGAPAQVVLGVAGVAGEEGRLLSLSIPAGATQAAIEALVPSTVASLGSSIPQVIVASPTDASLVAVSDRAAATGGLALVSLTSGTVERFDVGGPVRALAFEQSGERVFGLLDTEACAAEGLSCGGVFSFRIADHQRVSGSAQPPGVLRGIALGGEATLTLSNGGKVTVSPLVVASSTDGSVYLLDGATASAIDGDVSTASVSESYHVEPDASRSDNTNGPSNVTLVDGVTRSETISIIFAGPLPDLQGKTGTVTGGGLDASVDFGALGAAAGDRVVFADAALCPEATVGAVAAGRLELSGLAESCTGEVSFSVMAANDYVVFGSSSGYLGRAQANAPFASPGLSFDMGAGDPRPGAGYFLVIASGFVPFNVPLTNYTMPGAVVFDTRSGYFFVAFEGGDAIARLSPVDLRSGASDGVSLFR
jgi:hypothetical protein